MTAPREFPGHRGAVTVGLALYAMGLGLGRRMVDEAGKKPRVLGCPRMNIQVRAAHVEAVNFSQSMGKRLERIDPGSFSCL
ncbi:MAG: hypothetical protein HY885_04435 [Deltaproteobacteria bacterium]|nr:hypothetical protein [Deltaproteobacteria bacterium]